MSLFLKKITILSPQIMENIHMNPNNLSESRQLQAPCVKTLHLY